MNPTYSLDVNVNHPDGVYRTGETVTCTATLRRDGQPAKDQTGRCTVKFESKILRTVDFDAGRSATVTATADRPGWLYFGFEILGKNGEPLHGPGVYTHVRKPTIVGEIGALFDPEKIQAVPSRPADFDAYWDECRIRLDAVPLAPRLTEIEIPHACRGQVVCHAVEVPCLGKNPVRGYLAVPAGAARGALPALVDFQSLVWEDADPQNAVRTAVDRSALALGISWNGLPSGHPAEYYPAVARTWYEDRGRAGDLDRDTWFYHDMFYRVMRALDFIKSRPEWNQKDLVVQGGSLGGIQTIAAAALDPRVTLAVISVPSFCEFNGYRAGRNSAGAYRGPEGIARVKADPRRPVTLSYHDGVNFAPRITCETFVCTGFTDELCAPSGVYAFYNALPENTPKTMSTNPRTGHYGTTPNTRGNQRLEEFFRHVTVGLHPYE